MRLVMGVLKNAGDEKARQNEEQFYAVGPIVGHADDDALDPVRRQGIGDKVKQQDHQDDQAAHTVARRMWPRRSSRWLKVSGARALDEAGPP